LASGNLSGPAQKTHQTLLADLQKNLATAEAQLGVTHAPADPVASMSFGEKFLAAMQIALDSGMLEEGLKDRVRTMLEPSNRAAMLAQLAAVSAAYAALHGTPLAPFLAVADVGFAVSVGAETALALFQIYLDVNGATTQAELEQAAQGISNQLTGRVVDAVLSLLAKGAKAGGLKPGTSLGARAGTHQHHTIPKEIQKKLPPALRKDPDVRGRPGLPNRQPVDAERHLEELHDKTGISRKRTGIGGGKYNLRFQEEIQKRGGYNKVTVQDILDIRAMLAKEFGI